MAIPVAVFPGFSAGDLSTFFLRRHLQGAGYRVHRWRLGINRGNVPALVPKVVARTEALFQRHEEPVALVGWSLGGVLAREVARERPDLVKCIVTLGTPVVGGPKYTSTAPFYEKVLNVDLDALERTIDERNRIPIRVPITAIYTRNDGVVNWQACIDHYNEHCRHIEVEATHLSLGYDRKILQLVSRTIAQTLGSASATSGHRVEVSG